MRVIRKKQLVVVLAATAWSGCSGGKWALSVGDAGVDISLTVLDADHGGAVDSAPDHSVGIETFAPDADHGGASDSAPDRPVAVETSVPDADHGDASDGASDRIVAIEASVLDADYGDASAAPCSTPLAGTAPFAAHLKGSGTLYNSPSQPHQVSLELDIYFPSGRVAGAPVLLAMPVQYAVPALQVGPQSVLAADLSAIGLTVEGGLGVRVTGTLLPPDDGLLAAVEENISFGTDVAEDAAGVLKLCPTGAAPTPGLMMRALNGGALLAPNSTVLLNTATPLDATALANIKLYAGDAEVPISVRVGTALESSPLLLSADAAFPPETPLRLDTTTVTDILGRPVLTSGSLSPLTTTAVVSDLTFATAPTGAVATTGYSQVTDGELVLASPLASSGRFNALLALGSVAPARQARLRIGVVCTLGMGGGTITEPSALVTRASLVGAAGDSVAVPLACGSPQDVTVPLPASTGNIWLSVVSEPPAQHPQFLPYPLSNSVQIDEIAFE